MYSEQVDSSGNCVIWVNETGEYTVSGITSGGVSTSSTVVIISKEFLIIPIELKICDTTLELLYATQGSIGGSINNMALFLGGASSSSRTGPYEINIFDSHLTRSQKSIDTDHSRGRSGNTSNHLFMISNYTGTGQYRCSWIACDQNITTNLVTGNNPMCFAAVTELDDKIFVTGSFVAPTEAGLWHTFDDNLTKEDISVQKISSNWMSSSAHTSNYVLTAIRSYERIVKVHDKNLTSKDDLKTSAIISTSTGFNIGNNAVFTHDSSISNGIDLFDENLTLSTNIYSTPTLGCNNNTQIELSDIVFIAGGILSNTISDSIVSIDRNLVAKLQGTMSEARNFLASACTGEYMLIGSGGTNSNSYSSNLDCFSI